MSVPPISSASASSARYILLVRHGETDDNKNGVFQGQRGRGLNDRGRMQAEQLALRLSSANIDAIVSSDLDRAKETAEILARPHLLRVSFDQDLREVDVGHWTELSNDEIASRHPEEWAAWQRGLDVRRGNGETYAELGERMMRGLARIVAMNARAAICVSHGGAIRSVVQRVLGRDVSSHVLAGALNTSITLLECAAADVRDSHDPCDASATGGFRILAYNDASHLEDQVLARVRAS